MLKMDSSVNPVKKAGLDLLYKAKTPFKILFEPTEKDKEWWWRMSIKMENQSDYLIFVGSAGRIRLWRSLNKAIWFIKQTFPHIQNVEIKICEI